MAQLISNLIDRIHEDRIHKLKGRVGVQAFYHCNARIKTLDKP
jgi:hypothetical protein